MSCKATLPPILQQCALIDGMCVQFPPSFRALRPILEKRHHGPHHSSFHMPKIDLHVPSNKEQLVILLDTKTCLQQKAQLPIKSSKRST